MNHSRTVIGALEVQRLGVITTSYINVSDLQDLALQGYPGFVALLHGDREDTEGLHKTKPIGTRQDEDW